MARVFASAGQVGTQRHIRDGWSPDNCQGEAVPALLPDGLDRGCIETGFPGVAAHGANGARLLNETGLIATRCGKGHGKLADRSMTDEQHL